MLPAESLPSVGSLVGWRVGFPVDLDFDFDFAFDAFEVGTGVVGTDVGLEDGESVAKRPGKVMERSLSTGLSPVLARENNTCT